MDSKNYKLELAQRVLRLYDCEFGVISPAQNGYRNHSFKVEMSDGEFLNLMIFKAESRMLERIKRADMVSAFLAEKSLPTRVKVDQRIVKLQPLKDQLPSYAALYNYLPGVTIAWEAYSQDHLKVLGLVMARMHQLFSSEAANDLNDQMSQQITIYDELQSLLGSIENYLTDETVKTAMTQKLNVKLTINYKSLLKALEVGQKLPGQHVLHMDFVRGNVLFSNDDVEAGISFGKAIISGIIDFEKVSFGSPLFDLARTLAFLLVDCKYKQSDKIRKYFLYSGYQKYGQMKVTPYRLLNEYVKLFLLHDFYKFLKHNPYEFLLQNEHYLRTRDILLAQNMVEYSL